MYKDYFAAKQKKKKKKITTITEILKYMFCLKTPQFINRQLYPMIIFPLPSQNIRLHRCKMACLKCSTCKRFMKVIDKCMYLLVQCKRVLL